MGALEAVDAPEVEVVGFAAEAELLEEQEEERWEESCNDMDRNRRHHPPGPHGLVQEPEESEVVHVVYP